MPGINWVSDEFLRDRSFDLPAPGDYTGCVTFLPDHLRNAAAAAPPCKSPLRGCKSWVGHQRPHKHFLKSSGRFVPAITMLPAVFLAGVSGMALERRCYVVWLARA